MKKIICFLMFISLILPVYGGELQNKFDAEYNLKNNIDIKDYEGIDYKYLLKEDYNMYASSKGGSIYGVLQKIKEDINGGKISNPEKNMEYIQIMEYAINGVLENNRKLDFIDVSDEDFKRLNTEVKNLLCFYNNIAEEKRQNKIVLPPDKTKKEKFKNGSKKVLKWGLETITGLNLSYDPIQHETAQQTIQRQQLEQLEKEKGIKETIENAQKKALKTARLTLIEPYFEYNDKKYVYEDKEGYTNINTYLGGIYEKSDNMMNEYSAHPDNIKRNLGIIEELAKEKVMYSQMLKIVNDCIDSAYETYRKSLQLQNEQLKFKPWELKELSLDDFLEKVSDEKVSNRIIGLQGSLEHSIEACDEEALEISEYSYEYEKKKYNDWAKRNNKKVIKGALEQFVYYAYNTPQNGLYTHNPRKNFYLKVLQSVPGGIILTGSYSIGTYNVNPIFLQTSKKFADGQIILEPIVAEFKGYFDYTTVLGAKKRILKFYRYGENEIKNTFNIPGQPFYFYSPNNF